MNNWDTAVDTLTAFWASRPECTNHTDAAGRCWMEFITVRGLVAPPPKARTRGVIVRKAKP